MKAPVLCLSVLAVLFAPALSHSQAQVLMPGPPPLTEEMIGRFAEFFEWAFDVRLTNDQVDVLRKYSVDTWNKRKKDDIDAIVNVVALQVELSKADRKQLAVVRANYEPQVLDSMRKQPNEPMAVWALAVYESSHKVLAPGTPPLTRQTSDAFLEALFLMVGEVSGKRGDVPDEKLKNDWAAALTSKYAQMPAELKKQIAGMPLFVARKGQVSRGMGRRGQIPAACGGARGNRDGGGERDGGGQAVGGGDDGRAESPAQRVHEHEQRDDVDLQDQLQCAGQLDRECLPLLVRPTRCADRGAGGYQRERRSRSARLRAG
jgi:hypothetical protein